MTERNVFAPPKASLITSSGEGCTREGKFVVVQAGSDLPARCIYCNEPAVQPLKRKKLYWHTPWLYLLILINILLYAIVALIARKKVELSAGLCDVHNARRKVKIGVATGITFLMLGGAIFGFATGRDDIGATLLLPLFIMLVVVMSVTRTVYPNKITREYARIAGCKEPFLASIE